MTSDDDFSSTDSDIEYKYVPCPRAKSVFSGGTGDPDEDDAIVDLTVVGNANVGKTTILKRFATQLFDSARIETPGVDYFSIRIMTGHPSYNVKTTVKIADTAGQERYASLIPARLRYAYGIFIIFDTTSRESYEACTRWSETITRHNDFCCRVLVGNKMDLYRALPADQKWMEQIDWEAECVRLRCVDGCHFVSAKDGDDINRMMVGMVHKALKRQEAIEAEALAADRSGQKKYTTGVIQFNTNISVTSAKTCKC